MRNYYLIPLFFLLVQPCRASAPRDILLAPEGQVEARTSSSAMWIPVEKNVRILAGAEIRTGKDSKASVFFPDGSRFMLGNSTHFTVDATDKKKTGFQLKFGRLKAAVAGYFSSRFEVRTPSAVCAVRGTEFDIAVADNGGTEMNVSEGLVEVSDSKGSMAVVSSEEKIKIGAEGMSRPETVSLADDSARDAARPLAVRQESARERTRTMLEEVRNRELKANESQLGKDSIDAFGKRVRLEEYLLRPADNEFKLLFLSHRVDENRLDWGHLIERFNSKIPDDITQVGRIIDGMYFSRTAPRNWLKYFEVYLTNTIDSVQESIIFGNPTLVDFSGYGANVGSRYYPSRIDYRQILSGPGVAIAPGAAVADGIGTRTQFRQIQDYNTTVSGQFAWRQYVVDSVGALKLMYAVALDPADAANVGAGGTQLAWRPAIDPEMLTPQYSPFPSGPGKADFFARSVYADGSTVSSRKLLVSNEGEILGIRGSAQAGTFLRDGSYNLEMVVTSNLFQGRNIDVLLAPEILTQKSNATSAPGSLDLQ